MFKCVIQLNLSVSKFEFLLSIAFSLIICSKLLHSPSESSHRRHCSVVMSAEMNESIIAAQTLAVVSAAEKKLDAELGAFDINNADDLERLRQRRIAELKARSQQEAEWRARGHGTYSEVADQAEWFREAKESQRLVCHFYRATTWRCDILHRHLERLAAKHLETRFIRIDAEKTPFLAERLLVVVMPTIVVTVNNFTADRIEGFDELGGTDTFTTETLEKRLAKNGAIEYDEAEIKANALRNRQSTTTSNANNRHGAAIYRTRQMIDSEEDDSEDEAD